MFVTNKTANRSITVILLIVQEQFFVDVYGLHTATREKTVVINKLYNIYPTLPISSKYPKAQLTRQEQTLYNRLRIGHTYLTHSYLLKDEDPHPPPCNSLLTLTSIYTAELLAIRAALQYISKFSIKTSIIFTDTLSALQSLESQKLHQSLILSILTIIYHLQSTS